MTILGIETATSICSVGLVDGQKVLVTAFEDAGRRHSVVLTGMIDQALSDAGLSKDQIEGVAVSAGPGSFTGLRIGMALAKGICMASDRPLAVVSTLHALAVQSGETSAAVCACLDARHGELYCGVYTGSNSDRANTTPDAGRPVEDLITALSPDTTVVGYGISIYEDQLLAEGLRVRPDVRPSGGAVALVGEQILLRGEGTALEAAEPNYCRMSQAERLRTGEQA